MSCNHTLCLRFLCESPSTLQRKRNIAIPIWSGWFLGHRFSYYPSNCLVTTVSPAVTFLSSALAMKGISSEMHFNQHTPERETQTLKRSGYISTGHVKIRDDLSCRYIQSKYLYILSDLFHKVTFLSILPSSTSSSHWKWLESSRKIGVGAKQGKKRIFICGFKYFPDLCFQSWGRKRRSVFF